LLLIKLWYDAMLVKVVDRNSQPIERAVVKFFVEATHFGTCTTGSSGACHILITPSAKAIRITADAEGFHKEQLVDSDSGSFTFQFEEIECETLSENHVAMLAEKHFPGLTGIAFLLLAIYLAFSGETTIFQKRIILATFALAGAGLATELTGFLRVQLSFGTKLAIQAGGALAVFIILYLLVPAQ
jgi:hypothetical protein